MAVPKKKMSKSRRNNRRSHDKLAIPSVSFCGNCGKPIIPHNVCSHCGFYKDRRMDLSPIGKDAASE
jgi:large subunit ribosomal protein L32